MILIFKRKFIFTILLWKQRPPPQTEFIKRYQNNKKKIWKRPIRLDQEIKNREYKISHFCIFFFQPPLPLRCMNSGHGEMPWSGFKHTVCSVMEGPLCFVCRRARPWLESDCSRVARWVNIVTVWKNKDNLGKFYFLKNPHLIYFFTLLVFCCSISIINFYLKLGYIYY